ncbi:MAG: hypothetical protein ACOYK7_05235 [Pirellulales bacterium]|jgi:hypothetical protein
MRAQANDRRTMAEGTCLTGLLCCLAVAATTLTGCQVDVGGQTLPSAYYLQDDIQYFPAGPEFKLSKEAAALKAASPPAECESCQ